MNEENKEDIEQVLPSDTEQTDKTVEADPLKTELEKVESGKRSKAEKLIYTKKRVEEQLKELGIEDQVDEDDTPVTVGMLKKIQEQTATKTALQLADEIPNEVERELTKHYLENTVKSSGDPKADLATAQTLVNAVKNKQILDQAAIKPEARTHPSGSGAPVKIEQQPEFTAEELSYMKPPFNLSKEQVLAARPK